MSLRYLQPNRGVFPRVPPGQVYTVALGNGSQFNVGVIITTHGLFVGVEGRGAYTFGVRADAGYVAEKLNLPSGDAAHMADFINDQLFVSERPERQGSYPT